MYLYLKQLASINNVVLTIQCRYFKQRRIFSKFTVFDFGKSLLALRVDVGAHHIGILLTEPGFILYFSAFIYPQMKYTIGRSAMSHNVASMTVT